MPEFSGPVTSHDPEPGQRISHYEILSEIGRGGMGIVFRARNLNLGRDVALKCPRPDIGQDSEVRRRFFREARSASALSHPNAVHILDVFEHEGRPWLAMELVDGRSLRAILDTDGPLPCADVLKHAIGLAGALQAAHHKRILHRDVTPRNVLIGKDGRARLTDFGLARSFVAPGDETTASTESSSLSLSGHVVGTPGYMSPEQLLGQPVDQRTDIFSFGTLLYEACTGKKAFVTSPQGEMLDAILHREPEAISRHTYSVPEELERIIRKCLAKRPEERYQDAEDLLSDLVAFQRSRESGSGSRPVPVPRPPRWRRALLVGVPAVALVAVLAWWFWPPGGRGDGWKPGKAAAGYYDKGMQYLAKDDPKVEDLDTAAVMFRNATTEEPKYALAWAALGRTYWSRFGKTKDAASRDEADRAVDEALRLDPNLPEALSMKARGFLEQKDFTAARAILAQVVAANPQMHDAWIDINKACRGLGDYECGLNAINRAIELEPLNADDQILLGRFLERFKEFDAATKAYLKATELNPKSALAWNNLGAMNLYRMNPIRPAEAIAPFERAIAIEPKGNALSNLGTAYYYMKQYDKAAASYRRAAEVEPASAIHRANLGDALKMQGEPEEAHKAYLEAVSLARKDVEATPRDGDLRMTLGMYCARAGDLACALAEDKKAAGMQPESAEVDFQHAVIHCLAGHPDQALDWLEKSVKLGLKKSQIENDPVLPSLNSNPRYRRVLDLAS